MVKYIDQISGGFKQGTYHWALKNAGRTIDNSNLPVIKYLKTKIN